MSDTDKIGREAAPVGARRCNRLRSDKILIAFHEACDQADYDIADQLLQVFGAMLKRRLMTADGNRRRSMETALVAAHERMWHLRHADHRLPLVRRGGGGVAGMGANREITKEQLRKIRCLDDFDLIMLISEIHDHGWGKAAKVLAVMTEGKKRGAA